MRGSPMNLFHKYQSRAFQFTLSLLAKLEAQKSLSREDITLLAGRLRLDYADQVVQPLCQAGILHKQGDKWVAGEHFSPFSLPPGKLEQDYLQYILSLSEAQMFLEPETIQALQNAGGDRTALQAVQRMLPQGTPLPHQLGREGMHILLQAIREHRMLRYRYRTREEQCYRESMLQPWKIEYSAYDRRWWVILYDPSEKRTIKACLDNLKDLELREPANTTEMEIEQAMNELLVSEPVVLQVQRTRGALERCFLVFENQLFLETRQMSPEHYQLSFQYYRFDESEILRKLLYLGSAVRLLGPQSLRQKLLELVEMALKR